MYVTPPTVPNVKNAGARAVTGTAAEALVRPLLVVTICALPPGTISAGTRNVMELLVTEATVAASPFTVTPTPFRFVGRVLPVTVQVAEVADIPAPLMVIHV